jgi:hypothetical protein
VILDVDADGRLLDIELLLPSEQLLPSVLDGA